jgi:hypothetical protein
MGAGLSIAAFVSMSFVQFIHVLKTWIVPLIDFAGGNWHNPKQRPAENFLHNVRTVLDQSPG